MLIWLKYQYCLIEFLVFTLPGPKFHGSYAAESFALATSIALQIYYEFPDKWPRTGLD